MKNIDELLQERGVRVTAMRILIYKLLENMNRAVSLNDLENRFDKVDRTTLFRTIKTFTEKGLVHKIDDGSGITKYARCETGCNCQIETDLHLHFHCNICHETRCLSDYKLPNIKLPDGYIAENVNLVVKGICNTCSSL